LTLRDLYAAPPLGYSTEYNRFVQEEMWQRANVMDNRNY
jgi:hypothetical protein